MCDGGVFLHIQQATLWTSLGSCNTAQFCHYLPGNRTRFPRSRVQAYKTVVCVGGVEGMTSFLGLINFLEWLTRVREIFYLIDHWLIRKGCNSGRTRWKKCIEGGIGKGHRASRHVILSRSPHVHQLRRSPIPLLFGGWVGRAILLYIGITDEINGHWQLDSTSNPSPLPGSQGMGVCVLLNLHLITGLWKSAGPKSPYSPTNRHLYQSPNSKSFKELYAKNSGQRPDMYFLL